MTPVRIFVGSFRREFAEERRRLRDYLRGDPLMRRFVEVVLHEDVPGSCSGPGRSTPRRVREPRSTIGGNGAHLVC